MVPVKKILVLPDAGPQNPFQYLLIDYLRNNGFLVETAPKKRFFGTWQAAKKHQPDIIYYDWIQSLILGKTFFITILKCVCFFLEILYITTVKRLPIIHTLHNVQNHVGRWLFMERIIYRFFLQRCIRIRVYSEETKHKIISLFKLKPQRIVVIQDIPYHFYYPNQVSLEDSRRYLKLEPDQFIYLFLGMVKPYKGLESLIGAFVEVASAEDILIIAGTNDDKQYAEKIKSLAANDKKIRFYDYFIDKDDLQYYYNAADVVVLPFRNIEHSGSVDLAMSFAKPVITLKTDFLQHTLAHQVLLLFENISELTCKLSIAKKADLITIGKTNFHLADQSNYKDFLLLFKNISESD